ncbi:MULTISPECIES: hypothetical protein [Acidithiobacillus]|uniref:hypothetical protein n=1 Tax=Acidithiobacillus TaxID=119977 RepID=UPI001C071FB8|nr:MULTISPECIES: hypothetical protein [Acidithiobacillus]MBU2731253.1 hypothetical protein [Acidithiobacillus ferridurans]MDD5375482.1 hypothetical protein [Acidithiobacillus sp.]
MIKKLFISATLLGMSAQACATTWTIYNAANLTCENAQVLADRSGSPSLATPYGFRQAARHMRGYQGTKVYHYPDGQRAVEIKLNGRDMAFFSSLADCQLFKRVEAHLGHHISNLNQLK